VSELQELNLDNFTGGLNTWGNQFNLGSSQSPAMLNMEIDPRGGFYTRKGWSRWNTNDAVTPASSWEPRNSFVHTLSSGSSFVYVTNSNTINVATNSGIFTTPTITATADPHLADFAAWGDTLYIACGIDNQCVSRDGVFTFTTVDDAYGMYNPNYDVPDPIGSGTMPKCEFIETHSGYIFCANTYEDKHRPNRLRWSHPSQPENWAELDYIDIEAGGGKITALQSFQDHLLIFKTDSLWALYGYDSESWQLVRVSTTAGTPNTTAVTASERAVFFYSATEGGGIFAYNGGPPVYISQNLRTVMDEIVDHEDVWLGWAGKRLWCSLPWNEGGRVNDQSTALIFDPEVGEGAWVAHRSGIGHIKSIIEGSDVAIGHPLAIVCGCSGAAAIVKLEFSDEASDFILADLTRSPFDCYYLTSWQNAGWPERRKSWRRPRFVLKKPIEPVAIDLVTYFDYNETSPRRSHTVFIDSDGTAFWRLNGAEDPGGFDWNDGTRWGSRGELGSDIVRGFSSTATLGGLGVNRAIQIRFSTNAQYPGKAWGVNLVTLKYILRKFTT
jgi:hypothetical protein